MCLFCLEMIYISYERKKQKYDWFYKKPAWKKIRLVALERDDHLCQHCYTKYDVMTQADVVHHIVYVETDFTKVLDIENLISLCHSCHNQVHGEDEKRNPVKNKRQKMIESKKVKIVKV